MYKRQRLDGGYGNDEIISNGGASQHDYEDDYLRGGPGHDALMGAEGNDALWGGTGNDTIWGGDGDDLIFMDRNNEGDQDIVYGQEGNDTFVFNGGQGSWIIDYEPGEIIDTCGNEASAQTIQLGPHVAIFWFGETGWSDYMFIANTNIDDPYLT